MPNNKKTAIVTGAAQGIGFGIALAMAEQGYNVVVSDIKGDLCEKAVEDLKSKGYEAFGVTCNVAVGSEVESLINKTVEHYGALDVIVNNAGIYPYMPFVNMTEADWDKVMNVNLKSIFLTSSYGVKKMKEGGKIINISSIASLVGFENLVHYCTTKGGMNSFTRALALELAPMKITVNAVAPGAIATPGAAMTEEQAAGFAKTIPANRIGKPSDIAGAVVYLASDAADYVTGQVITVDGGWTIK